MYNAGYHTPVLLDEVLSCLAPIEGGRFLDGTLGGGGHAEGILDAGAASLIGVDRDPDALARSGARLARFGDRVRLVHARFADAAEAAGIADGELSGVLLDLGVSSYQIDTAERGFSFRPDTSLDMRMGGPGSGEPSAADLLNEGDERELADVLYRYGEEKRSRRLAAEIVRRRRVAPMRTSDDLTAAIDAVIPRAEAQDRARIFQALRIAVNRELEDVEEGLPRLRSTLRPGGVMVVLAYHSLEDRIVKNLFREWSRACVCPPGLPVCRCRGEPLGELMTRKPVFASDEEVQANPRARSARLRAWRRG